jgi:mono/diheme cytochrome c family protein
VHNLAVAVLVVTLGAPALAADQAPSDHSAGKRLAQSYCSQCHVVTAKDKKHRERVPGAPPDFTIVARDPAMTAEKLATFLRFPHGRMSNVVLTRKDIENVVGYIESLK